MRRLFLLNHARPTPNHEAEIDEIERGWVLPKVLELHASAGPVTNCTDWQLVLEALLDEERAGTAAAHYLAEQADREQFARVVREFALDGLVEGQNFFPLRQAHTRLYRDLLAELRLPQRATDFLDTTSEETFAFLNVFYWLSRRAPHVEYLLGALAYLAGSLPDAFGVQARACERLGITNGRYYTEQLCADGLHQGEHQRAIRELEAGAVLEPGRLWMGALLVCELLGTAFETAVNRARQVPA
jgi:hypothetical protein